MGTDETPSMNIMRCSKCGKEFKLVWDDSDPKKETLLIASCLSGGVVYHVEIRCPHCRHVEDIYVEDDI